MRFDKSSISSVVFSSSLFENNVVTSIGGALSLLDTTVDLIHNCTFVRNRADDTLSSTNWINVSHLFFIFFDLKLCCGSGCDCCPQFA